MEIFDCNVCFGVPYVPAMAQADTAEALIEEMAFCGVHRALVRHTAMENECPTVGNPLVVRETAEFEYLEPSWAILPPHTGELGAPDVFVERMKANGVGALWAFPSKHRYLLNGTTFRALFEVLIERRIPLFVPVMEESGGISGFAMLDLLLREFPKLILVATDHGCWGRDRLFRPLIERYENFYVDTSRYELDGGIKAFCDRYGPDRMLFGTAYPDIAMGGPVLTLAHADIPDEAKAAIFGGNLRRLLEEVRL